MSANGISHLQYKRQRQEQKLKLAKEKREAQGKPATLVKGRLPSMYKAGDNADDQRIINPNGSGLITGRPWRE
jgi:hypothetical protein